MHRANEAVESNAGNRRAGRRTAVESQVSFLNIADVRQNQLSAQGNC